MLNVSNSLVLRAHPLKQRQKQAVNADKTDLPAAHSNVPRSRFNYSFKSAQSEFQYKREKAYRSGNILKNGISSVFQYDRDLLSEAYFGRITEETKFSKPGWYLFKKEKDNSPLCSIIRDMNPRKYIKLYNEFYDSELKSAYKAARGEHKYLDESLNNEIKSIYNKNGNLDEYFEKRLDEYFLEPKEKTIPPEPQNKAYLVAQKNEFVSHLRKNPLHMDPEHIKEFISAAEKMLSDADKAYYLEALENMDKIAEAIYKHDGLMMTGAFEKLSGQIIPYWETSILKPRAADIEEKNKIISDFKQSETYKALNLTKQMDTLYSASGLTFEQKALFAGKFKTDKEAALTQNFLDFLMNNVPTIAKKRQIAGNVAEKVRIADFNFNALKETFIEDVRSKHENSQVIAKKLDGKSIGERVCEMLPDKEDFLINRLNEYTDEDLNKLLDRIKPLWLNEKYKEACEEEEAKYDMSDRLDDLTSRLTMKIDGRDVGIYEFVDNAFQKLYGENAKLGAISETMLANVLTGRAELKQHDLKNDMEYKNIMEQMESLVDMLSAQNKDSKMLHLEISKVLDKLEKTFPDQSRNIVYVRTKFERIKDGIKKSIFPSVLAANAGAKAFQAFSATGGAAAGGAAAGGAAACCDPLMMSIFALMYGVTVYSNIKKEFDKPC